MGVAGWEGSFRKLPPFCLGKGHPAFALFTW
jgi:hypothetical protein